MIKMVLDQSLLGLSDRFFDSVQLLRDVEAWPACLDHLDNSAQMTLGTLQPFDDVRMALMDVNLRIH
jgi:hypothetical protein